MESGFYPDGSREPNDTVTDLQQENADYTQALDRILAAESKVAGRLQSWRRQTLCVALAAPVRQGVASAVSSHSENGEERMTLTDIKNLQVRGLCH